jgi:hypothetical protein
VLHKKATWLEGSDGPCFDVQETTQFSFKRTVGTGNEGTA